MTIRSLVDRLALLVGPPHPTEAPAEAEPGACPSCGVSQADSSTYRHHRVCEGCAHHFSVPARERLQQLVDPGSFREINRSLVSADPLSFADRVPYRLRIFDAQRKTGLTDAVVTGIGAIGGQEAVIAVLDFEFLGGSMGCVMGEKVALAFERATRQRLPLVAVTSSGGARMQEGMLSLMQMAKTAAAAQRHHEARLPYLAVLADPTTGGVFASFASLADVIVAEPRALIGFAGPRVVEQTLGITLPPESHHAEFLLAHGFVDRVEDRRRLRDLLSRLLDLMGQRFHLTMAGRAQRYELAEEERPSAWQTVQLARHAHRPTASDYIAHLTSTFIELHGDRLCGDDPAFIAGLGEISGEAVVLVGQERTADESEGVRRPLPEGYRKAQRMMRLAAKLGLPLVTLMDTPGAYPGLEAEERGLANAIATSLALLSDLPVPVVAAVIGEGGSGGALALGVADRVLMLENAIYSVIAPEGAAAILYRDAGRAEEVASSLKITAHDCKALGVADVVVPEPEGGAHADPEGAARLLKRAILEELVALRRQPVRRLVRDRYEKFRHMGQFNSYFADAVQREVGQLQEQFQRRLAALREHLPGRAGAAPEPRA